MTQIIEHLYLGNCADARMKPNCHHVNCTVDLKRYNNDNFDFYRVSANDNGCDGSAFIKVLPGAVQFLFDKLSHKEDVLVHCFAGQQRSCAVIAAFLMTHYEEFIRSGSNIDDVVQFIRTKKRDAFFWRVNFISELRAWREAVVREKLDEVYDIYNYMLAHSECVDL